MSDEDEHLTTSRVVIESTGPGFTNAAITSGIDYTDGARVTVGWNEQDQTWYARCRGEDVNELADGLTPQAALLDLACSMAATIHALHHWNREKSP